MVHPILKSSKSKRGTAWGSLLATQTGFHAWKDLAFGVTKKTGSFVVPFMSVVEFFPESFEGALTLTTNAVPKRIVFPELFDLFYKIGVFFPFLRTDDLKG